MVVRDDPLPFQQLGVVGVGLEVDESVAWQVGHQLLQRGRHKLEAVDEAQPAERERYVFRYVVRYDVDATGVATECWGDEVGVVSPQVVHDDGDLHVGPALRLLPLEMQPEVTLVVCRAPIRSGQVIVVADHPRGVLPASVAGGGRGEVLDVGGRHHHRDGTVDCGVDEPVLVPQRLEEVVHDVRTAVHNRRRRVAGVVAHHVTTVAGRRVLLVAVCK